MERSKNLHIRDLRKNIIEELRIFEHISPVCGPKWTENLYHFLPQNSHVEALTLEAKAEICGSVL